MDEQAFTEQLRREGFTSTYVWEDGPNAHYPEHTHRQYTAHIVLSGDMTLTTPAGSASAEPSFSAYAGKSLRERGPVARTVLL